MEATLQVAPNKAPVVTRVKTLNVNISAPRRARANLTADLETQLNERIHEIRGSHISHILKEAEYVETIVATAAMLRSFYQQGNLNKDTEH